MQAEIQASTQTPAPAGIDAWVEKLSAIEVPVLARTLREIGNLKRREDDVTPREISAVVLRDPMLTLRTLRYIESRRRPDQPAAITTIEHALMMLGASPFFKSCERLTTVESLLAGNKRAMQGYMQVLSRAHHAAVYAKSWAAYRHDVESDEVIVATLLHDLAEMLLWYTEPAAALEVQKLLETEPGLRSAEAQQRVLGIRLHDLQVALCAAWQLPALLRDLMDDAQAHAPRVKNVALAVALARHSAHSWHNPALPDDYAAIARFLKVPHAEACERVARLGLNAGADDDWYGVAGAASMLPRLIPYAEQDAPRGIANALEHAQEKLLGVLLEMLPAGHGASPQAGADARRALVKAAVKVLHDDIGLPRVMFAAAAVQAGGKPRLCATACAGPDIAALRNFAIDTDEPHLFGSLLNGGLPAHETAVWVTTAGREALQDLLTPALLGQIGNGEFIAAAIKPGRGPALGMLYADRGPDSSGMERASVTAFNCVAAFLASCIGKLQESAEFDVAGVGASPESSQHQAAA